MNKPKVVFPFVEAGFGHIMTEKSIADAFEKKYGDLCDVERIDFYKNGGKGLTEYEKMLCREVRSYNKCHAYGYFMTAFLSLCGTKVSSWYVMQVLVPGAYKEAMERMNSLKADAVVSTHWATNYYASKADNKPMTIMYIPDAHANEMFLYETDLSMISMKEGYDAAMKKNKRFNKDNFKLVPLAIRKEAFEVQGNKKELREKLGHDDKFTIYLTEGGYGIGLTETLCEKIIEKNLNVTVIAVCGKNPELKARLDKLKEKGTGNVSFYPYGFTEKVLPMIASSDLYMGKSGNGLMEAAFFGVPIVVTHSANKIEKNLAEHYVTYVKDAVRIFEVDKCLKFIEEAINGGETYTNLLKADIKREDFGSEKIVDEIFKKINEKFKLTEE